MNKQLLKSVLKINHRLAELRPRAHWPQQWGRGRRLLATVALALCLCVPVLAVISDNFSDVPTGVFYHDAVNAIFHAGVTAGCAAGLYCPDSSVNRAQMALFLHRSLPRVAYGNLPPVTLTAMLQTVAVVTIDTGGVPGQTGFVKLDASTTAYTSTTECPCEARVQIFQDGGGSSIEHYNTFYDAVGGVDGSASSSVTWALSVPTGTTQTFRLRMDITNGGGAGTAIGYGQLTAVYVPFGSTGADSLAAPPGDDLEVPFAQALRVGKGIK